jgi:hypothetical protein
MKETSSQATFRTADIWQASYLMASSQQMVATERKKSSNGKVQCVFEFEDNTALQEALNRLDVSETARVQASMSLLRSIIYRREKR